MPVEEVLQNINTKNRLPKRKKEERKKKRKKRRRETSQGL
jgi:hypothetical protein